MSRRIYVAGGSDERREAQAAIDALKAAGWTVTHEWPKDQGYPENGGIPQGAASARLDMAGVVAAPFFWLRVPANKSEGGFAELGGAIVLRRFAPISYEKRCVIVSGPWERSIFAELADLKFTEHAQALAWLLEQAT